MKKKVFRERYNDMEVKIPEGWKEIKISKIDVEDIKEIKPTKRGRKNVKSDK